MIGRWAIILLVAFATPAAGRFLTPPAAKGAAKGAAEEKKAVVKPHNNTAVAEKAAPPAKPVSAAKKNASVAKAPKKNLTAAEEITSLQNGLMMIHKLQAAMTAPEAEVPADKKDLTQFAQGAMTSELQKKDSVVWSTIDSMMSATTQAMIAMKGKSKTEQEKVMDDLEKQINGKAVVLKNVTEKVGMQQEQHSEEYLLGVLMQHQKDWSFDKQLNATKNFADNCLAAKDLVAHHNSSQPLAPQLAAIMDNRKAKKAAKAAAEKKAAKLLIQLVSSLRRETVHSYV